MKTNTVVQEAIEKLGAEFEDNNEMGSQAPVSGSADEKCMQQCESCGQEFDIETMIEGAQWFCRPCYDELSTDEEFVRGTDYLDQEDFEPCSSCDGHDACADFGCAFDLGLGHLVENDDL